jgi:DNA-binding response OmpR family regulator
MKKQPISVLIVDDDQYFALNMSKLLKNRSYEVLVAFNADEALDVVQGERHIDVVVLDVKMPGMDGLTCLGEMKRLRPELEVIILTGHASLQSGIESIRAGAYDYLMKPCEVESLTAKVNEAYRLKRIRQNPVLWPREYVKYVFSPDLSQLSPEDPLSKAFDIMSKGTREKETLHISDVDNIFLGTISRNDILQEMSSRHPEKNWIWNDLVENQELLPDKKISEVMQSSCLSSCSLEEELSLIAERMIGMKLRCLPVVEQGRLIGIVQLKDVLRYVEFKQDGQTRNSLHGHRS